MSSRIRQLVSGACAASALALIGVVPASAAVPHAYVAPRHTAARTTGVVSHTYVVTTTVDVDLSGSAPAHKCEDEGDLSKCSLRAAFEAVDNDFVSASDQWDVIKVPAGDYALDSSTAPLSTSSDGNLTIEGAGPGKSVIDGIKNGFHNELAYEDDAGSWSVSGITFDGGYELNGNGGAFWMGLNASASFTDCSFENNFATYDAGAIYSNTNSALTVTDSTFSHNSAGEVGGAIYADGAAPIVLTGDVFSHNETEDSGPDDSGGAVYATNPLVASRSTFVDNDAYGDGGAVYADNQFSGSDDTFDGNSSYESDGGALYTYLTAQLSDSTFSKNTADDSDGGAIFVSDVATLTSDTFTSDDAYTGGDIYDGGGVTLTDSTLTKGSAGYSAGSIYNEEGALYMADDTVSDAQAAGDEDYSGGAIGSYEGYVTMTNVTLTGNDTTNPDGYGGALACESCYLQISNSRLEHNRAGYVGGAISLYSSAYVMIASSTINNNTSKWGGGVWSYDDDYVQIDGSTIDGNNDTEYWGGGLSFNDGDTFLISNSTIADNLDNGSDGYGGALAEYAYPSAVTGSLVSDTLSGNSATYGGAIYEYESALAVTSSTIADNLLYHETGAYAGGIYSNSSSLSSTDSIWAGNTGYQCAYDTLVSDGGFNLDSDNTCGFDAAGDLVNKPADLGTLAANGGPTETILPSSSSLAVGGGGTSCPSTDQRGVVVPSGATCAIGAVFVSGSKTTLKASHASIVKGHEQAETLTVAVTGKLKGDQPAGTVKVLDGKKLVCVIGLKGVGKSLTATGACSLGASTLPNGTATLIAQFAGAGDYAPSTSASIKVKVA